MVTPDSVEAAVVDLMAGPLVWGVSDCSAAACDVFARLHGVDPLAPVRGAYATEAGAARLIRRHGGWLALADRLARLAGLVPGVGAAGEIGLIAQGARLSLGIALGGGLWAGRIDGGYATTSGAKRSWACPS